MQTKKTITRPAHEDTVVDKHVCDICKAVALRPEAESPFTPDIHIIDSVTIEAERGSSYPDGGEKITVTFDICPTCFRKAVIPALAALGAQPRTEHTDW